MLGITEAIIAFCFQTGIPFEDYLGQLKSRVMGGGCLLIKENVFVMCLRLMDFDNERTLTAPAGW